MLPKHIRISGKHTHRQCWCRWRRQRFQNTTTIQNKETAHKKMKDRESERKKSDLCKKCLLNAVASTTRQFELNNKTKYIYIIPHLRAVKHFIFIFHIWCAFFPHVSLHISFSFDCLTFSACLLSFCCLVCRSIALHLRHAFASSVSFSSSFPVTVFRSCFCHFCQFQR